MDAAAPNELDNVYDEGHESEDLAEGLDALDEDVVAEFMGTAAELSGQGAAEQPGSSAPALPARLVHVIQLIEQRSVWRVKEEFEEWSGATPTHDAALLLLKKDHPSLAGVPRRSELTFVLASGPCVFFVEKPADGKAKRKRPLTQSAETATAEGERWIKSTGSSAQAGS